MLQQFTKLTTSILRSEEEELGFSNTWLQSIILVSLIWSFTGGISDEQKKFFDVFYRNLLSGQIDQFPLPEKLKTIKQVQFPEENTVFDWICTKHSSETWVPWIQIIDGSLLTNIDIEDIFVLTNENANQLYFMQLWLQNQEPFLIVGPQGNGKSRTLTHYLSHLSTDKYIYNIISMSGHVDSSRIQNKIMSKIDRRRKGVYGPTMGKRIVLAFDDFEATAEYGSSSQNVFELIRQLLEHQFWYDLEDYCRIDLIDFIFAGVITKTNTILSNLSLRFIHQVNVIHSKPLEESTVTTIFSTIVNAHFRNKGFSGQIQQQSQAIVNATLDVYKTCKNLLKRHKKLPSYFIDLKDVSRVLSGIRLMNGQFCQGEDELFRLWVHEIMRVFGDKFPDDLDRQTILNTIKTSSYRHLRQRTEQYMSHLIPDNKNTIDIIDLRKLCFSSLFSNKNNYDEVVDTSWLGTEIEKFIEEYNSKHESQLSCIVFQFVVECISSVVHALRKDNGHILMIGLIGSGRRTILRLTGILLNVEITEIRFTSKRSIDEWHTDLKKVLTKTGIDNTKHFLIFSGNFVGDENILDDINSLVGTSDLSEIYTPEQKSNILSEMMNNAHEEGTKSDTAPSTLFKLFVKRIKRNLHIAIVMSSTDSFFYARMQTCPAFWKYCSVYWVPCWPEDALENVAIEVLQRDITLNDTTLFNKCVEFCKEIHCDARTNASKYNEEFGCKYYVTSKTYTKFLSTFCILYKNKIEDILTKRSRYQRGLEKLNLTADQITSMQVKLQVLKPELLETSEMTEKLMIKIEQNTVKMEAAKEIVAADEALANEAAAAAQAIRDDCESDLSEAEPALVSATNALNTLKCSDITVIKSMKNPPNIVKLVLESVCVMKSMKPDYKTDVAGITTQDYWPTSLKLLSDAKFLDNLKSYDKENIDPQIMSIIRERFITRPDFEPDIVKKVSNACEGLCKWVRAMEIYDRVIKIVRPKKIKLANAEISYSTRMEKLNEKRAQLSEVMSKLQVLHDEWAEKTKQKKELEDSIEVCVLKLERAGKLLESLRYEKQRWHDLELELNEDLSRSLGDICLSSAFMTYLSIFPATFRNSIINSWYQKCQTIKLPVSTNYLFSSTFVSSNDVKFWNMAGLPTDLVAIDNYTIIWKTIYAPFIIDPQGLAKKFIEHIERHNDLSILKIYDQNFFSKLKDAITKQNPVLIEEVVDRPDEILLSVINSNFELIGGINYLIIGDQKIICSKLPNIYITTLQRKDFLNEIFNNVTLLDFNIIPEEVEYKLLKIITSIDAPELESKHNGLLLKCAEDCQSLHETEDRILNVLSSTSGNILEDETALETLNDSKNLMEEIRNKQQKSTIVEENLKLAYAPYKRISKLASRVFSALSKFRRLNPFYEISVDCFMNLFDQAVKKSVKSDNLEERIIQVNVHFIKSIRKEVEQILDKECVMIANFFIFVQMHSQLDFSVIQREHIFSKEVWDLVGTQRPTAPIQKFEHLFHDYPSAIFELNKFFVYLEKEKVISEELLRSLETENFIPLMEEFISSQFQEANKLLDLYDIYHNSGKLPIICSSTSSDIDPFFTILSLASEIGLPEDTVDFMPLTKTKSNQLHSTVSMAMKHGRWIVIQDFHLLRNSFKNIVYLVNETGNASDTHTKFKLWIVTVPSTEIPITILFKGIKIALKENSSFSSVLHQLYTYSSLQLPHLLQNHKSNKRWNLYFFLNCFCHAVLKIIEKCGIFYRDACCDITRQNFRIGSTFLEIFFNEEYESTIEEFKYILDDSNYQAHFCDPIDKVTLSAVINSLNMDINNGHTCIEILNTNFEIPEELSFNASIRYIQSLPSDNPLEKFGFHHCLISERIQTIIRFWKLTRKLYCFNYESSVNLVDSIIEDVSILDNICPCFEDYLPSREFLSYYLTQEIKLYRELLDNIRASLANLKNIPELAHDEILFALYNNEVPHKWTIWSYPFSTSLKVYIFRLSKRLWFINNWIHNNQPEVICLSKLFNVRGYFTTLCFNYANHYRTSLSDVHLSCEITNFNSSSLQTADWKSFYKEKMRTNRFGTFVQGLILIGGVWNNNKLTVEQSLNDYFNDLTIVWIEPRTREDITDYNYSCPLFYIHNTDNAELKFRCQNYITNINVRSVVPANCLAEKGVRLTLVS